MSRPCHTVEDIASEVRYFSEKEKAEHPEPHVCLLPRHSLRVPESGWPVRPNSHTDVL